MRLLPRFVLLLPLVAIGVSPAAAQMSASDVALRLDALESQIRQLTGQVEQLQYRNQQLEQQLKRTTEDYEFRFQEMGGKGGASGAARPGAQAQRPPVQQQAAPIQQPPVQQAQPLPPPGPDPRFAQRDNPATEPAPSIPGRRGDAFDPNANPSAPGNPRPLGSLPPGQPSAPDAGREPGAPLDLSNVGNDPRRGAPQRNPAGPGSVASVAPPSDNPRDYFDMGYGHFQRRDYANAEQTFRDFIARYPSDKMAPEANYWLGETFFQRQRYQDAAEAYLVVTSKYGQNGRAPDALLRLGQSLAAIGQKEMACASFAEIGRKYPNSSAAVKQGAEREQKRVRC